MAGSKSNNLENSFLTWVLSTTVMNTAQNTRPTAWYVGLFTDSAGLAVDQPTTESTSANCPGYTRQQITSWTIAGINPTQAQNNQAATFTATGVWSTVNYFGIYDALTGGNLLYWGSIPSKTLANTDQLQFGVNQITIAED